MLSTFFQAKVFGADLPGIFERNGTLRITYVVLSRELAFVQFPEAWVRSPFSYLVPSSFHLSLALNRLSGVIKNHNEPLRARGLHTLGARIGRDTCAPIGSLLKGVSNQN